MLILWILVEKRLKKRKKKDPSRCVESTLERIVFQHGAHSLAGRFQLHLL